MAKRILFSPVGGTDPISLNNMHDGSLLHICRFYKPDVVYLYMSKEVFNLHKLDNRYIYCLDKLAKNQGRKMEYVIIERENYEEVQRFDFAYQDIHEIIKKISEEMDEDDELYLNVSSGTPAMKSALLVLNVMGEYPFKAIQVSTPIRKMNDHNHDGYDVQLLWGLNEDNDVEDNRCEEIGCPALLRQKKIEIIKRHINAYDYEAALSIALTMEEADSDYIKMLEMAKYRLRLDFKNSDCIDRQFKESFFPVKSGDERKYYEYMLSLIIKKKKHQYADFLRALTPLILDLFSLILTNECKIKLDDLTYIDKKNGGVKWDKTKLSNLRPDIDSILMNEYQYFNYNYVLSDHLKSIITALVPDNVKLIELIEKIRSVEVSIRNLAAHQIISVDDSVICKKTGFNSSEIINMLIDAFKFTKINIKKEYWNSYDDMNDRIIKSIL